MGILQLKLLKDKYENASLSGVQSMDARLEETSLFYTQEFLIININGNDIF